MALALDNIGKSEEAIFYFEKVLAIEFDQQPFQNLADGDLELLEEFLEQAEEFFEEESFEEAISYYEKVLEIDSTNNEALFGKALALERIGKEDESLSNLEKISIPDPPQIELEVTPENTESPIVADDIVKTDQILFVIISVFIVILISIILIDYVARRRKNMSDVVTYSKMKQTLFVKPSSNIDSHQKGYDFNHISLDVETNSDVSQAMKTLSNLRDMNMLDNPETAKQFLLNKGFSRDSVKKALLGIGIDPSYVLLRSRVTTGRSSSHRESRTGSRSAGSAQSSSNPEVPGRTATTRASTVCFETDA